MVVSRLQQAGGVEPLCVEAGCPWENGVVESLNSILRDELLNTELFPTAKSARNMATVWRLEYDHRPVTPSMLFHFACLLYLCRKWRRGCLVIMEDSI